MLAEVQMSMGRGYGCGTRFFDAENSIAYAERQHTAGYHLRRFDSEFRAPRRHLKDLPTRQRRGEGLKHSHVELHVAVGCCKKHDRQH